MSDLIYDGDFTVAVQTGPTRWTQPIAALAVSYILEEDYVQLYTSFAPLPLGTQHPTYTTYYLVEESQTQALGGGVVRWTRTYAQTPATHYEPEQFPYSFIGCQINLGGGATATETRRLRNVQSRVQHDYFRLGVTVTDPITGVLFTPSDPAGGDIPAILEQKYVLQTTGSLILGGTFTSNIDLLLPSGVVTPTWPTSDQYQTMCSDAAQNKWNATRSNVVIFATSTLTGGPPPTSGHQAGAVNTASSTLGGIICAEPSRLDRWRGTIFLRRTRYVLAQ